MLHMHDCRSPKRRRTSDSPQPLLIVAPGDDSLKPNEGQEMFIRHTDFWLEDGNLILLTDTTAFRVFESILMKKSSVFAGLVGPGSLYATETFDNCSVIRLSDHPHDLADFLQCLLACSAPRLDESDGSFVIEFAEIFAACDLAIKYDCADVEMLALSLLKKHYTSNFTEYNAYDPSVTSLAIPPQSAAIVVIYFALRRCMHSMLPFAFYQASDLGDKAMDGYRRRDGSVEHLLADDLRLCIRAQTKLAWELMRIVEVVFSPAPSKRCRTFGECATARERIHGIAQTHARGKCNALSFWRKLISAWAVEFGLCRVCKREMLRREVKERRRVWMLLPVIFGFEDDGCGFTDGRDGESDSDSD